MAKFNKRSLDNLRSVHPDLVLVAILGLQESKYEFMITEGLRSIARQRALIKRGSSRTLHSKHLMQSDGYAHAFDVMAIGDLNNDGIVDAQDKSMTWDKDIYTSIANDVKMAASFCRINIKWGGDFKRWDGKPFFDGPHFQLV